MSKPKPSKNLAALSIQAVPGRVTVMTITIAEPNDASVVMLDGYSLCTYYGLACEAIGSSHGKEAATYAESLRERLA